MYHADLSFDHSKFEEVALLIRTNSLNYVGMDKIKVIKFNFQFSTTYIATYVDMHTE